ncbi:MAG: hypothetical protein V1836_03590 [Candidatus Aenigmatarchaeota archaeon]
MGKNLLVVFLLSLLVFPFALAAESTLSEGAVKFWGTWFNVPAKYMISWQSIVTFVVVPIIIALFFAYEIWKDLGIFHAGAANVWIPILIVYMMLRNGFWDYIDLFVSSTQMIPALVLSFLAMQVTSKLKGKVTSFGYSGIFGGMVGYALEAVSGGIFLGSIGFIISKGHPGPLVYIMASVGAGLGIFAMWWEKHGRKSGSLKNALGEEDQITSEEATLEKELKRYNKMASREKDPAIKGVYEERMVNIKRELDKLRAQEEVVVEGAT